ncbi:IS5 family transposase [Azospirillum sp.]|uniref:IS5 family transposase n=1 Tax=Azospirillum sp. TaxID=34012 RepID=UPI002D4D6D19|nr:IS5 family transposase [Azospirillum sp.]HYF85022.1 IS5 family transposase [Azospirillum sp.]
MAAKQLARVVDDHAVAAPGLYRWNRDGSLAPVAIADVPTDAGADPAFPARHRILDRSQLRRASRYQVSELVDEPSPKRVLMALCAQDWSVVHIAAHGVVNDRDGRTGIVLGGGLVLTADMLEQLLSLTPELVFVNCCHLGQISNEVETQEVSPLLTERSRLAANIALTGAALRKAIMAIWCVCFCGMQWRAIGQLSGMPLGTLYTLFARWTRLGLWRRLLDRLRRTWRLACGDMAEPSATVIDSRTCPSAWSCFARGVDGGKRIRGIKIHLAEEKYRIPLAIDAAPANVHDTKGIVPVLREIAGCGFQGPAIGDLDYRGERLANAGETLGITAQPIARGRDGMFIPTEIAWVVERSFSWISRYRRLNTIVERTKDHFVAFVQIAFISHPVQPSEAAHSPGSQRVNATNKLSHRPCHSFHSNPAATETVFSRTRTLSWTLTLALSRSSNRTLTSVPISAASRPGRLASAVKASPAKRLRWSKWMHPPPKPPRRHPR